MRKTFGSSLVTTATAVAVTEARDASGLGLFEVAVDNASDADVRQVPWTAGVGTRRVPDGRHALRWWVAEHAESLKSTAAAER